MKEELIKSVSLDLIDPPALDIRRNHHEDGIKELAESIREVGLIEPVVLIKKEDRYEIVAGHRRFLACQTIGKKEVEARVCDEQKTNVLLLRVHENLHRENLSPLEAAEVVGYLHYEMKKEIDEVCRFMKKSESWVLDKVDLLSWPEDVRLFVHAGQLKIGVAKELMKVPDENIRRVLIDNAVRGGVTVETARRWRQDYEMVSIPPLSPEAAATGAGLLPAPYVAEIKCFLCGEASPPGHTHTPNICGPCFTGVLRMRSDKSVPPG